MYELWNWKAHTLRYIDEKSQEIVGVDLRGCIGDWNLWLLWLHFLGLLSLPILHHALVLLIIAIVLVAGASKSASIATADLCASWIWRRWITDCCSRDRQTLSALGIAPLETILLDAESEEFGLAFLWRFAYVTFSQPWSLAVVTSLVLDSKAPWLSSMAKKALVTVWWLRKL